MNRVLLAIYLILVCSVYGTRVDSRDLGQWGSVDPAISDWFKHLMQPDNPTIPCCGEGDAYWADETRIGPNGETIAVITDDRDDGPLRRPHVPIGTRIVVPDQKIKWDKGNPTGHIVIFLGGFWDDGSSAEPHVYCYVMNGGV